MALLMECGWLAASIGACLQTWGAALFLRRSKDRTPPTRIEPWPGVSILKPLKGRDPDLEANLRSFFALEYPEFEILFAVEREDDPAVEVVHRLRQEHPGVRSRLVISEDLTIANPKLANLSRSYRLARYEVLLISDSNVRVMPDQLLKLIPELTPEVGMVSSIVLGGGAESFAGELEAAYLNAFYAKGMLMADEAGETCVIGKMMLFRKAVLDRLGGFRALGNYLAEDYMAGIGVKRLGLKLRLSQEPVYQHIGEYSFREFWKRHVRWGRIRKAQAPIYFFCEPLAFPITSVLLLAGISRSFWAAGALFLIYGAFDLAVMRKLGAHVTLRTVAAWFVRESLAPFQWFVASLGDQVEWRGRKIRVTRGGLLKRMDEVASRGCEVSAPGNRSAATPG